MAKRTRTILPVLLVVLGLAYAPRIPLVAAAGSVYVSPAVVNPLPVGSTFSIQVKVSGIDSFDGWEIQIVSDPNVINATSITTTGNIFDANTTGGLAFTTRNCVNGAGTGCCLTNACAPLDGTGIADSAYANTKYTSGNGLLFNVTFQVGSNGPYSTPYSPITIENDVISSGSTNVVHTTTSGSYGSARDFYLSANPQSLNVFNGASGTTTINVTSIRGFNGTINLATTKPSGITATLSRSQVTLLADGTNSTQLTIFAEANASATSYTVTVNATSPKLPTFALPHLVRVSVSVNPPLDFQAYPNPSLLYTHQSSSNSTKIIIKSASTLYNFTGTVNLEILSPPAGTTSVLDTNVLTIANGSNATATLTVTTQSSILSFDDYFYINATSGSLSHLITVEARPPTGDLSISANPPSVEVSAGNSTIVNVEVTSLDYFAGSVYAFASSQSGLGLSFDVASFFLNSSQTLPVRLKVTTDASTSLGVHTISLTVFGQLIRKAGQGTLPRQRSMNLTLTVLAPVQNVPRVRTFLGLQEPEFFGILGTLAIALAVLGIFEAKKSRRPKARPILES